ncbi:Uncharacterised protein [Escherichia coli]|uniref:Uncharacterized protein n=1 Tax=Escherichia coli TaxID=562 RepID=A0A376MIH9_ECOLX|nr:Uncharacterised protein [Escherichia coli]
MYDTHFPLYARPHNDGFIKVSADGFDERFQVGIFKISGESGFFRPDR